MKKIEEMLNRASDEVAMVEVFDTSETSFKRVDIIRKGYFEAGAEWMREELTRWHDPKKELPDTNRDVLVKTTLCREYRIAFYKANGSRNYHWHENNGAFDDDTVIGWREIHE